jgi:hypothetical protein
MEHIHKVYLVSHNSVTCKKTTINTTEQNDNTINIKDHKNTMYDE